MGATTVHDRSAPPPRRRGLAPPRRGAHWLTWLELGLLVAVTLLLLDGFTNARDLGRHDETRYLALGRAALDGTFHAQLAAWSPVSSLLLALVDGVLPDGRYAPDVLRPAIAVLHGGGLWFLLRAVLPGGWAVALTVLWLGSDVLTGSDVSLQPSTYLVAYGLLFWGSGCIARDRPRSGLALLTLAMADRVELAPTLALLALLLAWHDSRTRHLRGRTLGIATVAAIGLAAALVSPPHRARAWLTFEQHYAGATLARREADPDVGYLARLEGRRRHAQVTAHAFPGAESATAAMRVNPGAYARYALGNAAELPVLLGRLADSGARRRGVPELLFASLVAATLLAAGALRVPRRRLVQRWRALAPAARAVLLAGLATLAICVLLAPRLQPLYPLLPLVSTLTAAAALAWVPRPWHAAAGWLAAAVVGIAVVTGPRFPEFPQDRLWMRRTAELVQRHIPPDRRATLLTMDARRVVDYARRPRLEVLGPELDEAHTASGAARWWPEQAPPDYVLIHLDAFELAPRFTADLLARVSAADHHVRDLSPMWAFYAR